MSWDPDGLPLINIDEFSRKCPKRSRCRKGGIIMATNKIHFLATVAYPYLRKTDKAERFDEMSAAEVITNDSVRCWTGLREYTHFTKNPVTGEVSWIKFPEADVKEWTEEMVKSMDCFSAGKPGQAIIDEATVPEEMWKHNAHTKQNENFFLHLVQDVVYDDFVRECIDCSRRYENVYVFDGKEYTGEQLRGNGMERWTKGLINELDDQFYVLLAKRFFEVTGVKANRDWLENIMKPAIVKCYSPELAVKTIKFVSLSDKAEELITTGNFDCDDWPVPNSIVDKYIDRMMYAIESALITIKNI